MIDPKAGLNLCFGAFMREGMAGCMAFNSLTPEVESMTKSSASYDELYAELCLSAAKTDAQQVALWLSTAKVGSFVIMRHEYSKCLFMPDRLKDLDGKYIGQVYVIGVITKIIEPGTVEEERISTHRLREFADEFNMHSFCLVSWQKMGFKNDLSDTTKRYVSKVCQKSVNLIAEYGKAPYTIKTTPEKVRRDLRKNATTPISPADFPERFDYETRSKYLREKNSKYYIMDRFPSRTPQH